MPCAVEPKGIMEIDYYNNTLSILKIHLGIISHVNIKVTVSYIYPNNHWPYFKYSLLLETYC